MRPVPIFPYEVTAALRMRLEDFDDPSNGRAVKVRAVTNSESDFANEEDRSQSYDISDDATWKKLTCSVTVALPETELRRVVPDTSDLDVDAALVVLITCPATRFRHGVRLHHKGSGQWSGHVSIRRDDVRGSVQLRPQLIRTTVIPTDDDVQYATRNGAVIGFGETVDLYIDQSARKGLSSAVTMMWEDFANSDHPWRREHSDDIYHLEPFSADPRLWLNSRYTQLRAVLDSTARKGPDAALRDLLASLIAQPVMLQLSISALAGLQPDSDSGAVVTPGGWRGDMVEMLLPQLYPEESSDDDRLRRAASDLSESDGMASISSRLASVVQDLLGTFKTVEGAIRAFEPPVEKERVQDD